MSVVGLVPWQLVAQTTLRLHFNATGGDKKAMNRIESDMMKPLAVPPFTPKPTLPDDGWTLTPWTKGEAGRLTNGRE